MRLKQKEKAKLEDGIVIAYVPSESYTYVLVHVHLRKDIYFLLFDILSTNKVSIRMGENINMQLRL